MSEEDDPVSIDLWDLADELGYAETITSMPNV